MVDNRHLKTGPHSVVAAAGRDMLDREVRERGSVLSSAKTYLALFQIRSSRGTPDTAISASWT